MLFCMCGYHGPGNEHTNCPLVDNSKRLKSIRRRFLIGLGFSIVVVAVGSFVYFY